MRLRRPSMPLTNASAHLSTVVVLFSGHGNFACSSPNEGRSALVSRTRAVLIQDMCAEPTPTPRWATSNRSVLASISTPAFEALYGAHPGGAAYAASDETIST